MTADIHKAKTKREDGEDFPAAAFAYVPDPEKTSTWKLRLWDNLEERETPTQVGRAVAALSPGGFMGNRVQLPSDAIAGVKRKVLAAWKRVHDDDEKPPAVLTRSVNKRQDHGDEYYGADPMQSLLMAYHCLIGMPETDEITRKLMKVIHEFERWIIDGELDRANEGEVIIGPAEMKRPDDELRYRAPTRKIIAEEDGQFCVRSETGRSFGCYATREMAESRLSQIESFAERRVAYAADKELVEWHDRLHANTIVTVAMVACHDLIEDEINARKRAFDMVKAMSGSVPVVKADEQRFTLGPVYVPGIEDAHGEFTDDDTLQKALWDWMRSGDRTIYLQHSEKAAGEMVEMLTWPMPIETALAVPGEGVTKYSFPANTPFMGVVWESWAWDMVKAGELRGYSIGGKAQRMEADLPEYALV